MSKLFLPTTKDELKRLEWDYLDVILFSGDAYIDHPSFGTAVIARVLESYGYRVAVVPQPNWRDDLRDFKKLGTPRLFFGVTSGAMDSMVNHYTSFKRLRNNDAYTPGGKSSFRPDYATVVYSNILRELYPDTPIVIGGIEASLRRLTHYDYWKDKLLPSILIDSKADYLIYGMGEKPIIELAKFIEDKVANGVDHSFCLSKNTLLEEKLKLNQIAFFDNEKLGDDNLSERENTIFLHSYEKCIEDKKAFVENFNHIELQANVTNPKRLVESTLDGYIYINRPFPPLSQDELDAIYDLPYTFLPHPRYKGKTIPAYEMIKNSITIHRGCFGGCSFCTIAAHQGKFIQSRSERSILDEIKKLLNLPGFSGNISDIGAPSANMYKMEGIDKQLCTKCLRKSCLYPSVCKNLNKSHKSLLELYKKVDSLKGIRHSYIGSGVRYDLIFSKEGFYDGTSEQYFIELISKHISGRFKVAPEHTEEHVLALMNKPSFELFKRMLKEFEKINTSYNLNQQVVPYFISSHPGCTLKDMKSLAAHKELKNIFTEQVQSFTPTPLTRSSVMYYSGLDTKTLKPLFVERNIQKQREQKSYFFKNK